MTHVVVSSTRNLQQEVRAGPHRFIADEPADLGGNDTGPDPYSLLLSALGA
jgi:putative redox protein